MSSAELFEHLQSGATTVCRAWLLTRKDGLTLGFTDHDQDLTFESVTFKAETGLTALALQQQTGLSVDNSEAMGGFSDDAITETDLAAGRYDGAQVKAWLVNWKSVGQRLLQFMGTIGEIKRVDGRFTAELRSLTDKLNQPRGRALHSGCSAVLGDTKCRFDLQAPGYFAELTLLGYDGLGRLVFANPGQIASGWFGRGKAIVQTGRAAGLMSVIKTDKVENGQRTIEIWGGFGSSPLVGDRILLQAGCDKLAETCKSKFNNFLNFRGFPHIPGEDWLMSYPVSPQPNDGGSLF